ncbi:MAG: S1 family peptidase [Myxococcota bacterium]
MTNSRTSVLILVALLTLPLAVSTGCGNKQQKKDEEVAKEKPDPDAWRSRVVALDVEGVSFSWDGIKSSTWNGSGVLVAPGIMVTNAHVASRATKITGRTDDGEVLQFTRILAFDSSEDLAVVATDGSEDIEDIGMMARPGDPLALREREISAAGYTGGENIGEISLYRGRITTVTELQGDSERILHDAQISFGASGGPLFNADKTEIIGINHAGSHLYRYSAAIPSWTANELVETAKGRKGVPIENFVDAGIDELPLETVHSQKVCLEPGQMHAFPIDAGANDDVVFAMQTTSSDPIMLALTQEGQLVSRELFNSGAFRALTSPSAKPYSVLIGNHPEVSSSTQCTQFVAARINWNDRITE